MPNLVSDPNVWRVWDGMETVQYESARRSVVPNDTDPNLRKNPYTAAAIFDPAKMPNANTLDTGIPAKRRVVRSAEKSPSGGTYLGYEVNWWIPTNQFVPGFTPKPGDVIVSKPLLATAGGADPLATNQDTERWTALLVEYNATTPNVKFGCVNLSLAFDLRDAVNIERATISYDAAGSAVKLFPTDSPDLLQTSIAEVTNGGEVLYASLAARVQLLTEEIKEERGIRGFTGNYAVTVAREVNVTNEDRIVWRGRYLEIRGYRNATRIDELPVIDAELLP